MLVVLSSQSPMGQHNTYTSQKMECARSRSSQPSRALLMLGLTKQLAKKLSAIGLSKQSPIDPIDGRTPSSSQRLPKAIQVYCRGRTGGSHPARSPDTSSPPRSERKCCPPPATDLAPLLESFAAPNPGQVLDLCREPNEY